MKLPNVIKEDFYYLTEEDAEEMTWRSPDFPPLYEGWYAFNGDRVIGPYSSLHFLGIAFRWEMYRN